MDKRERKRIEDLKLEEVVLLLEKWDMAEFTEFVKEKEIDGRKLLAVTEGIVKLWRTRSNARKLIAFITDLQNNPNKYLEPVTSPTHEDKIEAQYQTVKVKKVKEHFSSTSTGVEDILKRIVPAKSFLYRNQPSISEKPIAPYAPMDSGNKKSKRLFRLSWYDYPIFETKQRRTSRTEHFNDRGYYSIKTNSKHYFQKTTKRSESKKYISLPNTEELKMYPEDHFYEDLNYNEIKGVNDIKEIKSNHGTLKPRIEKIQGLFQSFRIPFFKKVEEIEGESKLEDNKKPDEVEKDNHIYENSDSATSMYDSIHVPPDKEDTGNQPQLPVEDYLEPVRVSKDYSDVADTPPPPPRRDDSILGYILSLFDSFTLKRKTNDTEDSIHDDKPSTPSPNQKKKETNEDVNQWNANIDQSSPNIEQRQADKIADKPQLILEKPRQNKMADRPLPVPAENEPYFMNIDRSEAENLLAGQPDGTFVLRPSSQSNHAYTLTVSCSNAVHNVGVRRRPDGRLALGFARRGERSFPSVTSLVRHHRTRKLLLVAGGGVCGATTLKDTPQYYQTPNNLPV